MSMEILELKDVKTVADPVNDYPKEIRDSGTPIVIDNGSYNCRVGWATSENPLLVFKNLIAKPRKERGKKDGETQVGNDITNIEAVRFQTKTQFDRNVVTHFEVQEQIFDYIFFHLGIDTEGSVNHPVVLTEALLNPNYSRMLMSELLFECYGIPGVTYGVDMLFSYLRRFPSMVTGLIVNCGYQSTHIVPVLLGKADIKHVRRIDVGGFHITNYLHRLLQLKYPAHFAAITPSRAEELLHDHCFITEHYQEELDKWGDGDHYSENVRRIQLPYTLPTLGLSAEQHKERKKELARRLIEINARKREEKLAEDEDQLNQLLSIQEMEEDGEEEELQKALKCFDLQNTDELKKMITQIQVRIEKTKQKIAAANTTDDTVSEEPKAKIPKQIQIPKNEDEFKEWVSGIRKKRQEILDRRNARRQRRQDMARRRTVAAQERMRLISQLARKEKKDDDFGMRDEDWDVYKAINKEGGDTDSDEEAEKLLELEEVLRTHDPLFSGGNSGEAAVAPGEAHQLHVGIERLRAPELLFQPSMMGSCQSGIAETIQYVLQAYDEPTATSIVKNVYLTGGCALIPGLTQRLIKELLEMRPFKSEFNVCYANDPVLDAWRGAKEFALSESFPQYVISRQEYLEKGGEYFKEHPASNLYIPSPVPLTVPENMNSIPIIIQEDIEVDIV